MSDYAIGERNKVRRLREKAAYDEATVHAVLDAGLVAHVGFAQEGQPFVLPMIYGRAGKTLYLHGARKARIIKLFGSELLERLRDDRRRDSPKRSPFRHHTLLRPRGGSLRARPEGLGQAVDPIRSR